MHSRALRATAITAVALAFTAVQPAGHGLAQNNQHCGEVNQNEIWGSQDAHYVNCTVTIRNSKLTIAQGAQLLMADGASIIVSRGSTLEIAGNADANEPVRILPNDRETKPGFWGQILFQIGSVDNFVRFAFIQGGGKGGVPMIEAHAPVRLLSADLMGSGGAPLGFEANVVGPSLDEAGQSVGARCRLVNLNPGSHAVAGIQVFADDEVDLLDTQSWHNFCLPYRVDAPLVIAGSDVPTLTLTDGVIVEFGAGAGIVAGLSDELPGQLDVTGSNDAAVWLRAQNGQPGGWDGITFSPFVDPGGSANSLYFARISHGGSAERAMVRIQCPDILVLDAVFADAPGYPIELISEAVADLTDGVSKMTVPAFERNGIARLRVTDKGGVDLAESAVWKDPGLPLEIVMPFRVAGIEVGGRPRTTVLSLESGLGLAFGPEASLAIEAGAALKVEAGRARPVRMGPVDEAGSWLGVDLADGAVNADIAGLDLGRAGRGREAMLAWGAVPGQLVASTLHHAVSYPLAIAAPQLEAVLGEDQADPGQRNRYHDNGVQRLLVHGGKPFEQRLADLHSPGVPVEVAGDLAFAAAVSTVVRLHGGLDLRFRPGGSMQVSAPKHRADLTFEPGAGGQPVRMGPVDDGQAWGGLQAHPGASLNGAGLDLAPSGAEAVTLDLEEASAELADVTVTGAGEGVGVRVGAGSTFKLSRSRIRALGTGVLVEAGGQADVEASELSGHRDWGMQHRGAMSCVTAVLVYWGSPNGPTDPSAAEDGCMDLAYAGGGDRVSDHVVWWRYARDAAFQPAAGLGPGAGRIFLPALGEVR